MSGDEALRRPLPWQERAWERLLAAAADDALPHALLFAGPAESGCDQLARALAHHLLCHAPTAAGNCGSCKGCVLAASGAHGDLLALLPTGKGQLIQVAQVREGIAFAARTPSLGRRKVLLISPAERMNTHAANALLKCLEEPTPNTFLLLVTAAESRLPATVRSRCQCLRQPLPQRELALAWLEAQGGDPARAVQALDLARGRPFRAARLLESEDLEAAVRRAGALGAVLAGEGDAMRLQGETAELSPDAFTDYLAAGLHDYLRRLPAAELRSPRSRGLLAYSAEVARAGGALAAGANPQPDLLRQALLARLRGILGGAPPDARLPRVFSPAAGR